MKVATGDVGREVDTCQSGRSGTEVRALDGPVRAGRCGCGDAGKGHLAGYAVISWATTIRVLQALCCYILC